MRTTSMTPSSRPPSGVVKIRERSLLGTWPSGFSLRWQMETAFGLAVHRLAAFERVGGVDDAAFLAEDPDPGDALEAGHVLDDLVHVGRLVLQHREARAPGHHFGQAGDMGGGLVEQRLALVLHHRQREGHHRRGQRDGDEERDFELEGQCAHVAPDTPYFAGWPA